MRPPTRRTSTLITLYMPPQVKNITGAEYESTEMSPLTTTAAASIGAMLRDDIDMGDIPVASAGKAIVKKMAELIEEFGFGGASDQLQLSTGIAIGDRMEFVFKNPKKRAFPFQFDFYPKSEKEAQEVHQIIQTFRKHMLPTTMSQNSLKGNPIFKVPNQFNIEYFYKDNENSFLNKIGNCYLTDCDITYGGDRYTAFPTSSTKEWRTWCFTNGNTFDILTFKKWISLLMKMSKKDFKKCILIIYQKFYIKIEILTLINL